MHKETVGMRKKYSLNNQHNNVKKLLCKDKTTLKTAYLY